ncbi:hypothetical protein N7528_007591 [Penicillium herquei]|nr:hypothetical protein N7528_007591 [Penicillium herquei]
MVHFRDGRQHHSTYTSKPEYNKTSLETQRVDWFHKSTSLGEEHEESLCVAFNIAEILQEGMRYKQSLGWYRFVFVTESVKLGKDHPKTWEVRNRIADVLRAIGRDYDARRWEISHARGCIPVK